ncbi:MAG: TonB-dependent receptor domain-containing protein [Acidobacteriota bacterium]
MTVLRGQIVALILLTVVMAAAAPLLAQFDSRIEGVVQDASRGVMPGTMVTLTNRDTGVALTQTTTDAGYYSFPTLPPGNYVIKAEMTGFKTTVQENVRLYVAEKKTVNLTLEVGEMATEVTVSAAPPQVDTSQARVSGLVEEGKLHDLPLLNRNFYGLVVLTPGLTGSGGGNDIYNTNNEVALSAAGHRRESNNFLVDSASVTSQVRGGMVNVSPNVDSIAEVRVSVNNFSAEHGRTVSALVNVVTKQGTNDWHGSASWFHSQAGLTARTLFQPDVPQFRRNQGTGSIGGPIRKDKTFIFGSFDILRSGAGFGRVALMPTNEFINALKQNRPNGVATHILSTFPGLKPSTSFVTAGTYAGKDCATLGSPSELITTVIGTVPCNLPVVGDAVFSGSDPRNGHQWNVRADHVFNEIRDRLYASVYRTVMDQANSFPFPDFNVTAVYSSYYVNLNETHTFSPHRINELALSYVRNFSDGPVAHGNVGLNYILGMESINGISTPMLNASNTWELRDTVSLIHGSHNLRFGGSRVYGQVNSDFVGLMMRHGFIFLNPMDFGADAPFYHLNISFDPKTGDPVGSVAGVRTHSTAFFVHDDWKLRPNLSVNLGLRWEYFGNPGDKRGRLTNLIFRSGNDLKSRIADAMVDRVEKLWETSDINNFSPRLGFAWDPTGTGKMSIRAGVGLFYDRYSDQIYTNSLVNPPNLAQTMVTVFDPISKPVFSIGELEQPPYNFKRPEGLKYGLNEKNGLLTGRVMLRGTDPNFRNQYAGNWFAGIQYAIACDWVIETNYLGSAGRKLYAQTDANRDTGDLLDGVLDRLNDSFDIIEYGESSLTSAYHGGTVALKKRYNRSFSFETAYTFGKAIDQASTFHVNGGEQLAIVDRYDPKRQRGVADFDIPQKLVFSTLWEVPSLTTGPLFLNKALSGWQLTTISMFQSGGPFSIIDTRAFSPVKDATGAIVGNNGGDYNADGFNYDFPNAPSWGNSLTSNPTVDQLIAGGVLNTADFTRPAPGANGTLGRNTFRNRGYANVDFSILKDFTIPWMLGGEAARLQVRCETFNLLNRKHLAGIGNDLGQPATFGRVTSQEGARRVQFGLRVTF